MDRVIPPTRTARTMRERVEARRTRQQKIENSQPSFERARSATSSAPGEAHARPAFKFELPFASGKPADRRAGGRREPMRTAPILPATGSMAVPRRYGKRQPGRWQAGDRGNSGSRIRKIAHGAAALASSLATGWQALDPDLKRITKMAIEFLVAVVVVAGLGFGLFASGNRNAKANSAAAEAAPTAAAQPAAAAAPHEPVRIMLLGSDRRSGDTGYRTDVMLLLTIDANEGRVSVLSFPRDLVGKIPGYGDGRINIVMGRGGFSLMQDTFAESYGVRPQYYFLINFEGFVGLVNSIGGIEITAAEPLEDSCDLPQSRAGICKIEPGRHSMDGATALWYVRSRHSSSDFDRLRRAQEVMGGIFERMMSMQAVTRLPELYLQYSQDVETNMTIPQIAALLPTAMDVAGDPKQVKRYAIPDDIVADWIMPDGARVLLPDFEAVKEYVRDAVLIK